ncbi:hypothetical protein [Alicyclobacillus sendaiensis]|uniref:hypothetical protein n=1 Tax=Alicyclobacillus sendaiensis TaxID=192387 RepID=UPI00146FE424|nr:hypothetical protein [Alicyclobacillus sendaiensis]
MNRFLSVAQQDRYDIAFLLSIMTGLRKGEILGLRWMDVDFVKTHHSAQNLSYPIIPALQIHKERQEEQPATISH